MRSVRVGVTLKMYDYTTYQPKTLAEIASQARLAEEVGFDSVWVMDHLFIQRAAGRVLAHEPMIALAQVAASTSTIRLGTLVLNHGFRHIGQLAREAAALADMSAGRFVLGLGAGWHRPEFDALGLLFDHRVSRIEEAVEPLQRMLKGEAATVDGRWLHMSEASIAVTSPPPPLWIAAEQPRMLAVAARTEGWNHAYWGGADPRRFTTALGGLHRELDRIGRAPGEVEVSASITCVPGGWREIKGGFREDEVAVGPPERIAEVIHDYANAGAQHVILSLSPDPYAEIDPDALEKAARMLELL
ncbi:MAG TPA: LLM class flavin-dependent oxidoreductase [Candidatus Dormibacteraeota bacterium]|nr:LLM class flavin-dependent oxidoreductase [Candidatus Dormibacteraeota bacterium]